MNLPSDQQQQDYLDDLPQVLLHRANISNVRNFLLSEPDAYHGINDDDANTADTTQAHVAKSEVDNVNVADDSQDLLFKKEHFKFATQCPEITSQKAEKKSYHHGSSAKTVRRGKEPPLNMPFPSKYLSYELKIIKQPEEQHRARYLTEGSRGTVKDKTGQGHPTIRLLGCDQPVVLQVFVGTDTGKVKPHGFYQACKVSHKNSSACIEKEIDGTAVIELPMDPKNDMIAVVDCVGILKLRNADVEQRIGLAKSKKKSTVARLVFRVNIPKSDSTYQTLQISSTPILCTQPTGAPEISKKSLNQCSARGGEEMFIIGKNFMKGTTVIFEVVRDDNKVVWSREAEIDQDFFQSTHLVCTVPSYQDLNVKNAVEAQIVVNSGGRTSEPVPFFYTSCHHEIRKSPTDLSTCLRDANHFHVKNQQDTCFLKRSYALTSQEVPDEELSGVQFALAEGILNDSSDKPHLSDSGLAIDSPHCLNSGSGSSALLSSSIIIIPKEMSPQSTALIDNISPGLLSSAFGDGSPGLTIPVPISNDESLKLEHDLLEAGEPQFKRAAHDDDEGIQAFMDMVTDKNDQENLAELSNQKTMMWSQDLDKTCVLSAQSIQNENLGYGFSPTSQATMTGGNSSDGLLLEFNSSFESESKDPMLASKSFITLSTVSNTSSLMDAFPEGVPFISDLGHQSEGSQGERLFTLLSNESSCLDGSVVDSVTRLGEINSPEFLKLDDKMTVDESQSFGNDFLAQKTSPDIGMGCNLQQSLSELKDLTSKVGISSIQNQEEKPRSSGFNDQEIVPHLINVDQKFIFQSSVPDTPQPMSTSNSFKGVVMESFPTLSSSYEMVSDPRTFEQQSPFGTDKAMMTIQLINQQHQVDGTSDALTGGFAMMEAHSDPQNLLMNHHPVQQTIELSSVGEPLILPHSNSVDVGRVFRPASTDNQQVFSEKSLDQEMVVQHHYEPGPSYHHHQQSSNPSESANEAAEQRELYYLFSDDISGNILTSQPNQISPLPNLTIEEVSQVLNMSGS